LTEELTTAGKPRLKERARRGERSIRRGTVEINANRRSATTRIIIDSRAGKVRIPVK
jgi:hypothetical protein